MNMTYSAYRNGNYLVTRTGFTLKKRCFRKNEDFMPEFPDSIDLKISNRCNLGCPYCHESSVSSGKLANFEELKDKLSCLPKKSIEIAVGGGDILCDTESKNLFLDLAQWLNENSFITNLTINEGSIKSDEDIEFLSNLEKESLVNAIGISLRPGTTLSRFQDLRNKLFLNWSLERMTVVHIVLGLIPLDFLDDILKSTSCYNERILFLGYKQFGRAENTSLPETIKEFEVRIKKVILEGRSRTLGVFNNHTFGFDNLAIEQLNLDSAFLGTEFNDIFMGPEFSCSMYVDAVKGELAETSRSEKRVSWNDISIIDYFNHDKSKK